MLPLWRDRIRIALCPDKVVMIRCRKGLRPRLVKKQLLPCVANSGEPNWRAALRILKEELAKADWQKADVEVILSNHFGRYVLVPWSELLGGKEEHDAYVRYHFTKTYGDIASNWILRVSEDKMNAAAVASAVDRELLDELRAIFKESKAHLCSIQPFLMSSFNQLQQHFNTTTASWFLLVEQGKVCMALFNQGQWHTLRTSHFLNLDDLPQLLDREQSMLDQDIKVTEVFLHMPEFSRFKWPKQKHRIVHDLPRLPKPGFSPHSDASYAMALSGYCK